MTDPHSVFCSQEAGLAGHQPVACYVAPSASILSGKGSSYRALLVRHLIVQPFWWHHRFVYELQHHQPCYAFQSDSLGRCWDLCSFCSASLAVIVSSACEMPTCCHCRHQSSERSRMTFCRTSLALARETCIPYSARLCLLFLPSRAAGSCCSSYLASAKDRNPESLRLPRTARYYSHVCQWAQKFIWARACASIWRNPDCY